MFTLIPTADDEEDAYYSIELCNPQLGYCLCFGLDPLTTSLSKTDQISLSIRQSNGPKSVINLTLTSDALITSHTGDPGSTTCTMSLTPNQILSVMECFDQLEQLM